MLGGNFQYAPSCNRSSQARLRSNSMTHRTLSVDNLAAGVFADHHDGGVDRTGKKPEHRENPRKGMTGDEFGEPIVHRRSATLGWSSARRFDLDAMLRLLKSP